MEKNYKNALKASIIMKKRYIMEHLLDNKTINYFKDEKFLNTLVVCSTRTSNLSALLKVLSPEYLNYESFCEKNYLIRKKGLANFNQNCYINCIIHLLFSLAFVREAISNSDNTFWKNLFLNYSRNDLTHIKPLEYFSGINTDPGKHSQHDLADILLRSLISINTIRPHFISVVISSNLISKISIINLSWQKDLEYSLKQFFKDNLAIKLGSILLLAINRIEFENNTQVKNDKKLLFPYVLKVKSYFPKILEENQSFNYSLHGIVLHTGLDTTGGHYSVAIRDKDCFTYFSDLEVKRLTGIENNKAFLKTIYMLVYVRSNTDLVMKSKPVFAMSPLPNRGLYENVSKGNEIQPLRSREKILSSVNPPV